MKCIDHPDREAKWQCESCGTLFCENCVKMVGMRAVSVAVCPLCGQKCDDLQRIEESLISREPTFWEGLPHVLGYPFLKDGPFILVAGALFFAIAEFMANFTFLIGIIFSILITGYLLRYYASVMYRTARGRPDPPTWPDFDPASLFEESFSTIVKFIAPAIISYAPAVLYLYFGPRAVDAVFFALVALGSLYYPMGLAIAVIDDRAGLNPVPVIRSILRAPLDYFATSAAFMILAYLNYLREVHLPMRMFVIGACIRWLIVLYFWTVTMHLLGMFSRTHRHRLQWESLS
jgi:hypothetical protein